MFEPRNPVPDGPRGAGLKKSVIQWFSKHSERSILGRYTLLVTSLRDTALDVLSCLFISFHNCKVGASFEALHFVEAGISPKFLQMALQPKAGTTPCLRRMSMRFFAAPAKNGLRRIVVTTSLWVAPAISPHAVPRVRR